MQYNQRYINQSEALFSKLGLIDWLMDWLDSVLRRIGNISGIKRLSAKLVINRYMYIAANKWNLFTKILLQNHGRISTKLVSKHPRKRGIQFWSNEGSRPLAENILFSHSQKLSPLVCVTIIFLTIFFVL